MLPWAFEPGMGFERWVDYALDVPMYFVKRGDEYIDVSGLSFRDLFAGKLEQLPGERATISDWANHISTIFPGSAAEALSRNARRRWRSVAAAAGACRPSGSASSTTRRRSMRPGTSSRTGPREERQKLRDDVPTQGFAATIRNRNMLSLADETLKLARAGLVRRARLNAGGEDETRYLEPLEDLVARGSTPAEELLAKFHGPWGGSVEPVFTEYAY